VSWQPLYLGVTVGETGADCVAGAGAGPLPIIPQPDQRRRQQPRLSRHQEPLFFTISAQKLLQNAGAPSGLTITGRSYGSGSSSSGTSS